MLPTIFRNNREYTSLFDNFFNLPVKSFFTDENYSKSLNANIKEESDKYIIQAEVPGLEEKDLDISFENNNLMVRAEYEDESKKYSRSGSWAWSYYIPNTNSDEVKASLKNGILNIEIPKSDDTKVKKF